MVIFPSVMVAITRGISTRSRNPFASGHCGTGPEPRRGRCHGGFGASSATRRVAVGGRSGRLRHRWRSLLDGDDHINIDCHIYDDNMII